MAVLTAAATMIALPGPGLVALASQSQETSSSVIGLPESRGSATPEKAVREYLAGFQSADVDRILRTTAIAEISADYRFDLTVERLNGWTYDMLAPTEYPLYVEVNRAMQTARILNQVRNLAYSLLSTDAIDGSTIAPADRSWAEAFTQSVDPSRLADLTLVDIRLPDPEFINGEIGRNYMAARAAQSGADESTERVVLLALEGDLYLVGFELLRFGDGWKVSSQSSGVGRMPAAGWATPTTMEEFDELTGVGV